MTTPWFQSGRLDSAAIVANCPQPFSSASEVPAWTATPSETTAIPGAIIVDGRVFGLDASDTTSGHDGFYCCVSADGRRYKAGDIGRVISAETISLTTPPTLTSSIYGDAWVVPTAATGAWAGHGDDIAIATARGWVFVTPEPGRVIYVIDSEEFYHMTPADGWVVGLGTPSLGAVAADSLEWPWGVIVESRTLNAPTGLTGRKAYIIGTSPTGAWAGMAGYLAVGPDNGWSYIAPVSGGEVWCRAENRYVRYVSGAWTADAGYLPSMRRASKPASVSGGSYTISATAPTVGNTVDAGMTLSHAARAAGNVVRIRYQGEASVGGVVALFVDAAASADQWFSHAVGGGVCEFVVSVSDISSHQYSIRTAGITATKSSITLEELSVTS